MSDLERAQEWLGCRRSEFVGVLTGKTEAICEMHGLADDWPCSQATRLAALLAETRADEDERWRAQWEGRWKFPTSPDDYECCASGSCEVCRR